MDLQYPVSGIQQRASIIHMHIYTHIYIYIYIHTFFSIIGYISCIYIYTHSFPL